MYQLCNFEGCGWLRRLIRKEFGEMNNAGDPTLPARNRGIGRHLLSCDDRAVKRKLGGVRIRPSVCKPDYPILFRWMKTGSLTLVVLIAVLLATNAKARLGKNRQ